MNFSERLIAARKDCGLSRKSLADGICSERSLINWESGLCEPPVSIAAKLAERMGVSVEHLLSGRSGITASNYQTAALRTAAGMNYEGFNMLINSALGICGEGGEFADLIKKSTFQGHELDKAHLAKELGDVCWYVAVGAYALGYDLGDVMEMNVAKLRARYPDGFDADKSRNRKAGDV